MSTRPYVWERAVAGATKWLQLLSLKYCDAAGKMRTWDMVHRATSPLPTLEPDQPAPGPTRAPDAVAILTLINPGEDQELHTVLVRQFRPPMNAFTIEFPAGLLDEGESPAQAALRELKEETGYVGNARSSSLSCCLSPGLTSECVSLVTVDVDMSLEENQHPIPNPDEGEYIDRIVVPISGLMEELDRREQDGDVVFAALRSMALGYLFKAQL